LYYRGSTKKKKVSLLPPPVGQKGVSRPSFSRPCVFPSLPRRCALLLKKSLSPDENFPSFRFVVLTYVRKPMILEKEEKDINK
jgi:hypothetical protein